ncbi:MAG: diguanylate cyclase [Gammaproteobacteria bacterium]|nr:diguanylate cyclase [Gammaproteobacteria bacterium]MDH5511593.1 diguanylate cyclase [Gammaproteobacteria bacterium]
MATRPENYQEQLRALRHEYIQRLPEKLGEIEAEWADLLRADWDAEKLRTLHRRAHSLVGSGATFGFPSLSDSARGIEQVLKELTDQPRPDDRSIENRLDELLMELRKAVIQASRELTALPLEEDTDYDTPVSATNRTRMVYLVEDSEIPARDMALQLRHFGYEVRIFNTLKPLREALKFPLPDAIIMDILMPDGDGISALADISRDTAQGVPALVVTVLTDFEARLRAVRAGASAYLLKPVDIGELVDKLDRLTGNKPAEPFRVLIIDDSTVLTEYYALILQHAGMLTRTCHDPRQVMTALEDFNVDLILTDVYMPGCDGFELAAVLRQQNTFMSVPIVFLSTETDLDRQLTALGTGADEFLTKPITPHHLISAVTSRARRARLLRELMLHDSLTGLLNHSTVKERLVKELAQALRHHVPVSLAMIDIDHFKSINDRYGHLAGDRVIKSLARLLQQRLRQSDLIGRYGGEEFLILLYDTIGQKAQTLMDKLRGDFSELKHQASEELFRATFSCGIAAVSKEIKAPALTDIADRALYQAKHNGRNQVLLVNA